MSALHHTVRTVTPFHDRSRPRRLLKIALWLVGMAVVLAICHLAGFDVLGWFESVWDTMKEISPEYIVAGVFFQTIQTTLTALAWYYILAAGLPGRRRPLPRHPRGLRRRCRDERLPAGEHRHVRVAPDVRRADPRLDLRRCSRRDPRAEDLLHLHRRVRLSLSLPLRARARSICSSASSSATGSSCRS